MFGKVVVKDLRKIATVLSLFSCALSLLLYLNLPAHAQSASAQPQPAPRATPQASATQINLASSIITPSYLNLGKSVKGRDINALVYGSGEKRVLVIAGIHGDEQNTSVLARSLAVHINAETLPKNLTVIIVPDANPDGLLAATRVNANGVDINRNFPAKSWRADYTEQRRFPGAQPSSEPETRAVLGLLERYPPQMVVTLHAAMGCVNWDGPGGAFAAQKLASINGYPLCESLGYETPGSLGLLMGVDRQIPTVTIELRAKNPSALVEENLPALLALLKEFAAK
ncbi:MAG TPA: M14 family murein peptide amidase A [Pyrinomonadaceae bacterium]